MSAVCPGRYVFVVAPLSDIEVEFAYCKYSPCYLAMLQGSLPITETARSRHTVRLFYFNFIILSCAYILLKYFHPKVFV